MIVHQHQPTQTSCGPTCVAMIVGVPARDLIAKLPGIRVPRRRHKRNHGTNMYELLQLLNPYGFTLDWRTDGRHLTGREFALLRVHEVSRSGRRRRGWHWCLLADGCVYDPLMHDPMDADVWLTEAHDHKLFYYLITQGAV